ncbi:MAG: cupin domain-containing protein [Bacteroidia bacterium]|nr:cupin domain-containing protein [Bacteroidia bacterium]NNF31358.1 cupin domain-containing protein [Flavobacteriaceae bacterium]MBT8276566.1 cupin domain-containing protein [Bacteroidia bacterium]NNJ82860.1 cupin domain-containing protein [Flavobacteriaceae bacterium]NNK54368.1 cupin domain-containing protein [Flavobacteriaceae bacterium]
MDAIEEIIANLQLQPHPEGGYYRETYRSEGTIPVSVLGEPYSGDRNIATGIYFLITSGDFSAFHKIHQDEMWHYYKGAAMNLHLIAPDGKYTLKKIGNDLTTGEVPQHTVPGGYWFASEVSEENSFSLMGCTVAPGFDFKDFEMPSGSKLIGLFPQHKNIIDQLTRN